MSPGIMPVLCKHPLPGPSSEYRIFHDEIPDLAHFFAGGTALNFYAVEPGRALFLERVPQEIVTAEVLLSEPRQPSSIDFDHSLE